MPKKEHSEGMKNKYDRFYHLSSLSSWEFNNLHNQYNHYHRSHIYHITRCPCHPPCRHHCAQEGVTWLSSQPLNQIFIQKLIQLPY